MPDQTLVLGSPGKAADHAHQLARLNERKQVRSDHGRAPPGKRKLVALLPIRDPEVIDRLAGGEVEDEAGPGLCPTITSMS